MKTIIIFFVNFYQKFLSLDTGLPKRIGLTQKTICVFYPTCSEYTKQSVKKYGVIKGLFMGFKRILRCHPWQKNHIDPVA